MGRRKLVSPLDGQEEYILSHTRKEIMERFNLNYDSVNNYCVKHNLHPVREKKRYNMSEEMISYLQEHTLTDTANKFRVSYSCKRSGEAREMIFELSKTFSYASIARVFGYTKERIRQICNEMQSLKE